MLFFRLVFLRGRTPKHGGEDLVHLLLLKTPFLFGPLRKGDIEFSLLGLDHFV